MYTTIFCIRKPDHWLAEIRRITGFPTILDARNFGVKRLKLFPENWNVTYGVEPTPPPEGKLQHDLSISVHEEQASAVTAFLTKHYPEITAITLSPPTANIRTVRAFDINQRELNLVNFIKN